MIEIGLVECPPLAFVDRARIAVAKLAKRRCIEGQRLAAAVIAFDRDLCALDRAHRTGDAVGYPRLCSGCSRGMIDDEDRDFDTKDDLIAEGYEGEI